MPITDTRRREILNSVTNTANNVINWTRKSINNEATKMERTMTTGVVPNLYGQPLYVKLFGEKPYTMRVTPSLELSAVMSSASPISSTYKMAGYSHEADATNIYVPLLIDTDNYPKQEVWVRMDLERPMPYIRSFTGNDRYMSESQKTYGIREFAIEDSIAAPSTYVPALQQTLAVSLRVQSILRESYPEDFVDSVLRTARLALRIGTIYYRLSAYMTRVRSEGALYLNLPTLTSIINAANVKHVRYMRQGEVPPPLLVEDINLLATLYSAVKAARAAGGQS